MIREAIDKILSLATPHIVVYRDRQYCKDALKVLPEPQPAGLQLNSLTALASYIDSDLDDEVTPGGCAILVSEPDVVRFVWSMNPGDLSRGVPIVASPVIPRFEFGKFYPHEAFVIALQTMFVETDARAVLLQRVGNVTADEIVTSIDDGVTQAVTAKAGVALKERVDLPNPVHLRPYRTFHEVEQPASPFVLRARKGHGGVELALFEADGGAWRAEAIASVVAWLQSNRDEIGEIPILA